MPRKANGRADKIHGTDPDGMPGMPGEPQSNGTTEAPRMSMPGASGSGGMGAPATPSASGAGGMPGGSGGSGSGMPGASGPGVRERLAEAGCRVGCPVDRPERAETPTAPGVTSSGRPGAIVG